MVNVGLYNTETEIFCKEDCWQRILPKPFGETLRETEDNKHQVMTPESTAQFPGLQQISRIGQNPDYLVSLVLFSPLEPLVRFKVRGSEIIRW